MKREELKKVLELHKKWLNNEVGGVKADLRGANLQDANLYGADLQKADLYGAYLQGADLRFAYLQDANLRFANLLGANLRGADLDFSVLNLSCSGLNFKIDERIAKQLLYHTINLMQYSGLNVSKWIKKQAFKDLETSHLVTKHRLNVLKEVK